jgi:hypothetical protein
MNSDVSIRITKQDKAFLDNLLRILGRAKLELEGVEILAAADSMRWLSRFQRQIEEEAKKPPVEIKDLEPIKSEQPKKRTKSK